MFLKKKFLFVLFVLGYFCSCKSNFLFSDLSQDIKTLQTKLKEVANKLKPNITLEFNDYTVFLSNTSYDATKLELNFVVNNVDSTNTNLTNKFFEEIIKTINKYNNLEELQIYTELFKFEIVNPFKKFTFYYNTINTNQENLSVLALNNIFNLKLLDKIENAIIDINYSHFQDNSSYSVLNEKFSKINNSNHEQFFKLLAPKLSNLKTLSVQIYSFLLENNTNISKLLQNIFNSFNKLEEFKITLSDMKFYNQAERDQCITDIASLIDNNLNSLKSLKIQVRDCYIKTKSLPSLSKQLNKCKMLSKLHIDFANNLIRIPREKEDKVNEFKLDFKRIIANRIDLIIKQRIRFLLGDEDSCLHHHKNTLLINLVNNFIESERFFPTEQEKKENKNSIININPSKLTDENTLNEFFNEKKVEILEHFEKEYTSDVYDKIHKDENENDSILINDFTQFCKSIGNLHNLEKLYFSLSGNSINNIGAKIISNNLFFNLKKLKKLDLLLRYSKLEKKGIIHIANALGKLKKLGELFIKLCYNNNICDLDVIQKINANLLEMKDLQTLEIENNSNEEINRIPKQEIEWTNYWKCFLSSLPTELRYLRSFKSSFPYSWDKVRYDKLREFLTERNKTASSMKILKGKFTKKYRKEILGELDEFYPHHQKISTIFKINEKSKKE
jgi:hypothetical protein